MFVEAGPLSSQTTQALYLTICYSEATEGALCHVHAKSLPAAFIDDIANRNCGSHL